jgi:glycerol-3-phosphate dehydrogenase
MFNQGLIRSSYFLNKQSLIEKFPMLNERGLKGAIVYFDGMLNDARVNLAISLTAASQVKSCCDSLSLCPKSRSGIWSRRNDCDLF